MSKKLKIIAVALAGLFWAWYVANTLTVNSPPPKEQHVPEVLRTAQEVGVEPDLTNSTVLFDMGYGQLIRVPKKLFSDSPVDTDSNIVKKSTAIGLSLMYPEMVYADDSPSRSFIRKNPGQPVVPKGEFQVFISLYYSPDELKGSNDLPEHGLDFRPSKMLFNRTCYELIDGKCVNPVREVSSQIPGLDMIVLESAIKANSDVLKASPSGGAGYVAPPGAGYELLLHCSPFDGVSCVGYVFIKKNRFQYSINFPPEEVGSTVDLISRINKLVDSWLVKK